MNKSDLRTGMLVTLRNNETYYVMLNTGLFINQADVLIHKVGKDTGWMPLCQYADDMTFHDDSDSFIPTSSDYYDDRQWDIVQVESCREPAYLFQPKHYRIIWTRE